MMVDEQAENSAPQAENDDLDVHLDDVQDSESLSFVENSPNLFQRLRRMVYKLPVERYREQTQRLRELNWTIDTYPEAASNYVLRGELYILMNRDEAARTDFEYAITLLDNEEWRWGIGAQALRDRAFEGLSKLEE